jgi:ATP-dependent Clp protease ATP-binding subunit ClpA
MATLTQYENALTNTGKRIFRIAVDETRRREVNNISPVYILAGIAQIETELFDRAVLILGLEPSAVRGAIAARLDTEARKDQLLFPPETANLFSRARGRARAQRNQEKIDSKDLLWILAENDRSVFIEILSGFDIERDRAVDVIRQQLET